MTTRILVATIDANGRLTVDCDAAPGDGELELLVDGIPRVGTFIGTMYGYLFQSPDGNWGLPGLGWGPHDIVVTYATKGRLAMPVVVAAPPHPRSTLGGPQLSIPDLLKVAYAAGFKTEASLLPALAVAVQESGLCSSARNWHPESGFRPVSDVIGVVGPPTAWNMDHTRQGHSDRGTWQISSQFWSQYSDATCDDPAAAAKAVWSISHQGTDWGLWAAYTSGAAQARYDQSLNGWPALRPLVAQFIAGPH